MSSSPQKSPSPKRSASPRRSAKMAPASPKPTPAKLETIADIVAMNPEFSTLLAALKAADLVDTLGSKGKKFTVFAPTNSAFDKVRPEVLQFLLTPDGKKRLTDVLLYHVLGGKMMAADVLKVANKGEYLQAMSGDLLGIYVVDGEMPFVNNALIIKPDVMASNGVIHVINNVLDPMTAPYVPSKTEKKNVVDVIAQHKNLSVLADFLTAADLLRPLVNGFFVGMENKGWTIFAPTNEAFAKIPKDKLEMLIRNKGELRRLLEYHVVPGEFKADVVTTTFEFQTLLHRPLFIFKDAEGKEFFINKHAKIMKTNIDGVNGVIHTIDNVLMPSFM